MKLRFLPWLLAALAVGLSLSGHFAERNWYFSFEAYSLFPLFGLIAFSLMWSHYAVDFLQRLFRFEPDNMYLPVTRYLVLFSLLMHPGLLAYAQWQAGFGFPPASLLLYAGMGLVLFILIGMLSWLIFLSFELHRWFRDRAWFVWIQVANAIAMLLIVLHAIELDHPMGWFRYLWYFYGLTMAIFLLKEYYDKARLDLPKSKL